MDDRDRYIALLEKRLATLHKRLGAEQTRRHKAQKRYEEMADELARAKDELFKLTYKGPPIAIAAAVPDRYARPIASGILATDGGPEAMVKSTSIRSSAS